MRAIRARTVAAVRYRCSRHGGQGAATAQARTREAALAALADEVPGTGTAHREQRLLAHGQGAATAARRLGRHSRGQCVNARGTRPRQPEAARPRSRPPPAATRAAPASALAAHSAPAPARHPVPPMAAAKQRGLACVWRRSAGADGMGSRGRRARDTVSVSPIAVADETRMSPSIHVPQTGPQTCMSPRLAGGRARDGRVGRGQG